MPPENNGAGRAGFNPLLIGAFVILLLLGAVIVWMALSGGGDAGTAAKVTLQIGNRHEMAEDLIREPAKPPPQITAPPVRRVLATSLGPDGRVQLAPAPDAAVAEQGKDGLLPKIAADGAQAWHVYSHPFPPEDARPRIAIIIGGIGLSKQAAEMAMQRLPARVSLSIVPYAEELQELTARARATGHELLLELPMEPFDYPENDPGPYALLTTSSAEENTIRLEWLLGRFPGYIGAINYLGGKFITSEAALWPVMAELKGRGLMMIDDQTGQRSRVSGIARRIDMPVVVANTLIDGVQDAEQIDARLASLEQLARANGRAAGIGLSYPLTIERVVNWAAQLDARGIALAPVSALVEMGVQAPPPIAAPPDEGGQDGPGEDGPGEDGQ